MSVKTPPEVSNAIKKLSASDQGKVALILKTFLDGKLYNSHELVTFLPLCRPPYEHAALRTSCGANVHC